MMKYITDEAASVGSQDRDFVPGSIVTGSQL